MDFQQYDKKIQALREKDFPQLLSTTYLDHAGTTLYAQSLIDSYCADLKANLFGNPHSASPSSDLSSKRVDATRAAVLEYFNADPQLFDVIFCQNATAAIKLVMYSFHHQGFWYGYHKDAHTSLVGVRELASKGSRCFPSNQEVEDWIESDLASPDPMTLKLFAYPAQSNMTGHRMPLSWSKQLRASKQPQLKSCYTLLDAASYLTTGRLDLSDYDSAPDFISLSFYKIFGFPDLGALIVRKDAYDVLKARKYFGGGTVDMVIDYDVDWHAMHSGSLHAELEDGTLPFHNIVALQHALRVQKQLFGTSEDISQHTSQLCAWLQSNLNKLRHYNGMPVMEAYKEKHSTWGDRVTQGPIISFSLLDSTGHYVWKSACENLGIACGIQLRTGGVCNAGGISSMLDLAGWEMRRNHLEGMRCGNDLDVLGGKPTGIIRVSLGPMSTMSDVKTFLLFIKTFFVEQQPSKTPVRHNPEQRSYTSIVPIQNGPKVKLPEWASDLAREGGFETWELWHQDWCIIDLKTGKPVELAPRALANHRVSLKPEEGILRLSTIPEPRPGATDLVVADALVFEEPGNLDADDLEPASDQQNSLEQSDSFPPLVIDIWEVLPVSEATHGAKSQANANASRPYDIYNQPSVSEWLSAALGMPCTLARYRRKDRSTLPEATTCPVRSCLKPCGDQNGLKDHYNVHGRHFQGLLKREGLQHHVPGLTLPKATAKLRSRSPFKSKSPVVLINEFDSDSSSNNETAKNENKGRRKLLSLRFLMTGQGAVKAVKYS